MVFNFHNGPTVNESEIIILLRHVWVFAEKREGFERGRRENEIERKTKGKNVPSM